MQGSQSAPRQKPLVARGFALSAILASPTARSLAPSLLSVAPYSRGPCDPALLGSANSPDTTLEPALPNPIDIFPLTAILLPSSGACALKMLPVSHSRAAPMACPTKYSRCRMCGAPKPAAQ